jgi:predicted alpha/beta superfamily hydrolase
MKFRLIALLFLSLLPLAAQAQVPAPVGVVTVKMKSTHLNEERVFFIRTPAGYDRSTTSRHPVLYLTDGETNLPHTLATIDFLARNGRMQAPIVVGIANTDRTRDLTPTKAVFAPEGRRFDTPTAGGANNFLDFIEKELIPFIEKNYRTVPYRIFAGHSFGGLFAMHAFATRPQLFNAVVAVSPTLNWDNRYVERNLEALLSSNRELRNTLYISVGDEGRELAEAFARVRKLLETKAPAGLAWEMREFLDEDHGSVLMPTHYHGFRKIYEGWAVPRDPLTNGIAGIERVEAHYRKLSEKFGYEIPVPEGVMNVLGYQLMANGRHDDAIVLLARNAAAYPDSANVYDSLGEAYEKSGKTALARDTYKKAVEVGKKTNDPNLAVFKENYERAKKAVKTTAAK